MRGAHARGHGRRAAGRHSSAHRSAFRAEHAAAIEEGLARNARLRIEGTRNLVRRRQGAGVNALDRAEHRFRLCAGGEGVRVESDPLDLAATGALKRTVDGVVALEQATLADAGRHRAALRLFLRPRHLVRRTSGAAPAVHVDAAAQAALLAVSKGSPASTTSPRTTARCRAKKRSTISVSTPQCLIPAQSLERLAQEPRALNP